MEQTATKKKRTRKPVAHAGNGLKKPDPLDYWFDELRKLLRLSEGVSRKQLVQDATTEIMELRDRLNVVPEPKDNVDFKNP